MLSEIMEHLEYKHYRKRPCPGFGNPQMVGGMDDNPGVVHMECPEILRRDGHRPDGGKGLGYPESWDKSCPTCKDTAEAIAHLLPSEHLTCPFCHPDIQVDGP